MTKYYNCSLNHAYRLFSISVCVPLLKPAISDRGCSSQKIAEVLKNDLFNTLRLIDCSALVISGKVRETGMKKERQKLHDM